MSRHRSIVSDRAKYEIARELGFADKIEVRNGAYDYGNITTREAGLIVRGLIEKAEQAMADEIAVRDSARLSAGRNPVSQGFAGSMADGISNRLR